MTDSSLFKKWTEEDEAVMAAKDAEIRQLKIESNENLTKLLAQIVALKADNERLKLIEQAAEKAYRHHMSGYGKEPAEFNANKMLDLMNELGAVL